ncbi:MAG: heavy-metal-associated domain-containing protein [Pseudomonadota bacterium]|nr:heavy-metal-associated domain-containing protein [Pseudomonadota bacterium]
MYSGDIVIHIDETLDEQRIHDLERALGDEPGVVSACVHEKRRHLMLVDFDAEEVQPSNIVQSVRNRGLHAEMIGF